MTNNQQPTPELLCCPFCNAHAVETVKGWAIHHIAECILGRLYGSTFFGGQDHFAWNTRALSSLGSQIDVELFGVISELARAVEIMLENHGTPPSYALNASNIARSCLKTHDEIIRSANEKWPDGYVAAERGLLKTGER